MFVVNLPAQMFEVAASALRGGLAVLMLVGVYYLLWVVVRLAFGALAGSSRTAR